jgi:hypothetical protein
LTAAKIAKILGYADPSNIRKNPVWKQWQYRKKRGDKKRTGDA